MHAATSRIVPVYAFVGRSGFLRGEAAADILGKLAGDSDALDPVRLDGGTVDLADVLDEVRTPSLLGSRRVVLVDEADALITAHRARLERYCSNPAADGCLILLCTTLPRNTRLFKAIAEHGKVISCDPPKGRAVLGWITNRARTAHGKRMAPSGADCLRERLGDEPGTLDAELAKLAAYVGQRADITPADIDALTGHHREEKVFAVTDAISSGNAAEALRQWEQVLATDRAAPGRAIAGLAWGVRRLLQARRDWDAGTSIQALARRMYTDPQVLENRLQRIKTPDLEEQQRDLLQADWAVKTGAATVGVAVEKFIVKHAATACA